MLRTRVLTALVIGPLAFALVFMTSTDMFGLILAALLLIGSWEFSRLASLDKGVFRWLLIIFQTLIFVVMYLKRDLFSDHAAAFLTAGCLTWMLMFVRLLRLGGLLRLQ